MEIAERKYGQYLLTAFSSINFCVFVAASIVVVPNSLRNMNDMSASGRRMEGQVEGLLWENRKWLFRFETRDRFTDLPGGMATFEIWGSSERARSSGTRADLSKGQPG